ELFGDARWRRRAIGGVLLATAGVVGLWGIGFFGFDLVNAVFRQTFEKQAVSQGEDKYDRQFVQSLLQPPAYLPDAQNSIRSANQLVTPEAKLLYKGMLALHESNKDESNQPITRKSVLAWTDQNSTVASSGAKLTRQQLEEFVGTDAVSSMPQPELVDRIVS